MAKPPRFTDSTTVVGKAPPIDPWVNQAADRGAGMDFSRPGQLGNAWTDQFNSSVMGGRGFGDNYTDPVGERNVYRGAINAQGQKVSSDGDPLPPPPTGESDGAPGPPDIPGTFDSRHFGNAVGLQKAITPSTRNNPNPQGVMTSVPWAAPRNAYRDAQGRIRYETTPGLGRRFLRGVGGLVKGIDTGKTWLNVAQPAVRKLVPFTNLPLGIGGAVQRFRSNDPVTKIWDPNDPDNQELPEGQTRPVPDASRDALDEVLADPGAHRTQSGGGGGGDYTDPNYNYPWPDGSTTPWVPTHNPWQEPRELTEQPTTPPGTRPPTTTPPASNPNAPAATSSPLPTTAQPTGRQAQPRGDNPENRVNPETGDPDPNGVLPQHMPGYVPPAAPTYIPFTQEGVQSINALYRKYYGRDATPEEAKAHTGNPGGLKAVEALLKKDTANLIPGAPGGPPATTPPKSPAETAAVQAATGAGSGGGGYSYAGFDFGQDPGNRDIQKSAKYAFSHFAGQAAAQGVPQPRSKAEAQAWFEQYIAPGMNANGFTVHKVVGDKAFISTRERPQGQWIDFQGNSGGEGDQPLTWQAENAGQGAAANPEQIFAPQLGGGGGGGGGVSGMDRGPSDLDGVLDSGNPALDSFAKTLIERLLSGMALDEALQDTQRTTGISPSSLAAVGF